jgi:ribokinase
MAEGVILSLGSVNVDIQLRAPRWPAPEETLPAESFTVHGGGKAANVAFLARRLGRPAWLLARVGEDAFAEQALRPLEEAGVDLRGVQRVAGEHTGVSLIVVPPDGGKGILLAENANQAWDEAACRGAVELIEAAPAGSVLAVDFELPAPLARRCMDEAHRRGLRVVLDPSPAGRVPEDVLRNVYAATPNAGEAEKLLSCSIGSPAQACRAAERLCESGVELGIVKLNDGGCVYAHAGEARHLPPPGGIEAVDTTGAGDAFTGALSVALLEGRPVEEAVRWAVMASQIAVTGFGSQPAYPDREELERALQRWRRLP